MLIRGIDIDRPVHPQGGCLKREAVQAPSVLLVDAFADARQMYAEYLATVNFRPIEVDDAADALKRAQDADVIVTAICLPGPFDGIELVRRLRASDAACRKPIIVLSACALETERKRALEVGCSAFLPKPCLPDALVRQIRILLGSLARPQTAPESPPSVRPLFLAMFESGRRRSWFSRLIRPG
jgi:DNA-binding response OmpR family regulator